jgi:L-fuconolactonase
VIIDSHLHVWDRSRAQYSWIGPDLREIDRSIALEEVKPSLKRAGVTGVVLVQSADEPGDTDYMLEVATDPLVLGVVGWVPLEDPLEAERRLSVLRQSPVIVGIRNLVHDRPDPDWALRPEFDSGLGLLEDAGLPFDFVTSGPDAMSRLVQIADRHPRLRVVLDHLGKPPIGGGRADVLRWTALMREAAARPNVFAKVSGLYAVAGHADGRMGSAVGEAVDVAFETFGADRLMYGGDWPMSLLAGGYDRVFGTIVDAVAGLGVEERECLLWRNATAVYQLPTCADTTRTRRAP